MTDYTKFYGFSEDPFDISPDPKFFFPSESHNEALASLLYGINQKKGFILILGDDGIGKTTTIHHLINQLDKKVTTLFFPQSHLPFHQILKEILLKLNLPLGLETKGSMIHELNHHLIRCLERDETVALIIDQAQNIGVDVIEEVRLLANLETSTSKLLQIVLVGQPELGEKLRSDVIRQIKQRIVISYRINPLTEEESMRYIDHRLKIVSSSAEVFTDDAMSLICRYAKGIPLVLNNLCSNALSEGYGRSEERISPYTVKKVRGKKEILTPERAQILTSGVKRYLPHKISYVIPALVIFAVALFFGRSHWQPLFYAQQPNQSATQPPIEDKFKEITPEVKIKEIIEVKKGATLSSIAYQYYKVGDETFIDYILKFNPEITNPNLIFVNQKIKIPEMTESSMIVQSSESQYKVHLKTFGNLISATQYRRTVASMGKKIEIVPWKVSPKETWYRVMVGPFAAKAEGLKFIEEMKKKGFLIISSKKEKS